MDKYSVQMNLASGFYGESQLATDKQGRRVVIKDIKIRNLSSPERDEAVEEVQNLMKFSNVNIVPYRDVFLTKQSLYIVTDYADCSLASRIKQANGSFIEEGQILEWFTQICFGLKYSHDHLVIHRNLHSHNVYLTNHGVIKIGDFGIATIINHSPEYPSTYYGTPYMLSPETCLGDTYDGESDIWALGCILYELATLNLSFSDHTFCPLKNKMLLAKQQPIDESYSTRFKNLIDLCLTKNPCERPTVNQLLKLDIIRNRMENIVGFALKELEFSRPPMQSNRPRLGGAFKSQDKAKKTKLNTQQKNSHGSKSEIKRRPPPSTTIDQLGLEVQATHIKNPAVQKRQLKKYDIMASLTSNVSSASSVASYASKAEYDAARIQEIQTMQKEKEAQRIQKLKELEQEARQRQEHLNNVEAPFKKIKEKSKKEFKEEQLYMAVEVAKPPPAVQPARQKQNDKLVKEREHAIGLLADLIAEKREEVQKMKKMQEKSRDDVIMIGNMEVEIEQPKSSKSSTVSSTRSIKAPNLRPISESENNDYICLASVAKNLHDYPPEDLEGDLDCTPSKETGLFIFNGLPLDLPMIADNYALEERVDALRHFCEEGIGENAMQQVTDLLRKNHDKLPDSKVISDLCDIFKSQEMLTYYPFVQQLLYCEYGMPSE